MSREARPTFLGKLRLGRYDAETENWQDGTRLLGDEGIEK